MPSSVLVKQTQYFCLTDRRIHVIESYITLREGRGNPIRVAKVCNPGQGLPSGGCCKSWSQELDSLVLGPSMWSLIVFLILV